MLLAAVVLHAAVLPQLRVAGVAPDLLLVVAIAAGIAAGPERAAVVGFASGLLADTFLQTPFGLSALTYCVVAYAVGLLRDVVMHASVVITVVTAVLASALGVTLFVVLGALVGQAQLVSGRVPHVILVVALVNGVLVLPVLAPVRWATAADPPTGLAKR